MMIISSDLDLKVPDLAQSQTRRHDTGVGASSASSGELKELVQGQISGRNWPLQIMLTRSIPAMVDVANLKLLKPSIGLTRRFMKRWFCSTKLLKT